jgi:hypothetical protein
MDTNGSEGIFTFYVPDKKCAILDKAVAIHEILNIWMINGLVGQVWWAEGHLIHNL